MRSTQFCMGHMINKCDGEVNKENNILCRIFNNDNLDVMRWSRKLIAAGVYAMRNSRAKRRFFVMREDGLLAWEWGRVIW